MSKGAKTWFSSFGKLFPSVWNYIEKRAPNVKTSRWLAQKQLERETRLERKAIASRIDRVKKVAHDKTQPVFKKLDQSAKRYNSKVNYATQEFNDAAAKPEPPKAKVDQPPPVERSNPQKSAWANSPSKQAAPKPKPPTPTSQKRK